MLFELERGLISLLVTYMYYEHEVIKFHLSRSGLQVRKLVVRLRDGSIRNIPYEHSIISIVY